MPASQGAIEPLEAAMRLDPNDQDPIIYHLAVAYFGLRRYEDAAVLLKRRIIRKAACYGHLRRGHR